MRHLECISIAKTRAIYDHFEQKTNATEIKLAYNHEPFVHVVCRKIMPLSEILKEAKFITFIIKHLGKEEIFQGENLYKAFLPPSKSINNYFNNTAQSEKAWGDWGLKAAREFAAKLHQNKNASLYSLYFDLGMARRDYEYTKSNDKTVFGWPRDAEASYSTSSTSIFPSGKYADQFPLLEQLLQLNFGVGKPDVGDFIIDTNKVRCQMMVHDVFSPVKQKQSDICFYRGRDQWHSFLYACIKRVTPLNGSEEFLNIEHASFDQHQSTHVFNAIEDHFLLSLTDKEKYEYAIALVSWPLFQSVKLKRGSASVTEWVVRGTQLYHDPNHLPRYRFPVNMDLLAIFTPTPEKFAKIIAALFYDCAALVLIDDCVKALKEVDDAQSSLALGLIKELQLLRPRFLPVDSNQNNFRLWQNVPSPDELLPVSPRLH